MPFPSLRSLVLLLAAPLAAQQVALIAPAADNTLYQSATGSVSNGAGPALFVGATSSGGIRRAVLRFDVAAALPPGAKVLAATLDLSVLRTAATAIVPATGHRLLAAFGEGTSNTGPTRGGTGVPATSGDATWLHTFFPGSLWTTPGGDFAPTPSFVIDLPLTGTVRSQVAAGAAADVQGWLDQPASNFGWLLKTDELAVRTAHKVGSREATSGAPVLRVTYLTAGQAAAWGTGCAVGGGTFALAVGAAPVGGTTVPLQLTGAPAGQLGALLFALQLDPAGVPGLTSCRLYLPLGPGLVTGSLFTASGTGTASVPVALPAGFPGVLLATQAAALTGQPGAFVLSNAAALVL